MSSYDLQPWPLFRSLLDEGRTESSKTQHCFVAGPFDSTDAAVRDHVVSVWNYVVRPALLDTPRAPHRIDAVDSEDHIAKVTVDALLADPIGILIARGASFSVDYALTVNKAMKRPMILLVEEGRKPEITVEGAAIVTYSFRPEALLSPANITALQAALRAAESTVAAQAAAAPVSAAAATAAPPPQPFSDDQRVALMKQARRKIDLMGLSLLSLGLRDGLRAFLCSADARGIEVRVLQCAPKNPGLPPILGGRDAQRLAQVQSEIDAAAELWARLANNPDCQARLVIRQTQTAVPLSNAVITETSMAVTPHSFARALADGPTYVADAGSPEHAAMIEEFEALWGDAAPPRRHEPAPQPAESSPPLSASFDVVQRVQVASAATAFPPTDLAGRAPLAASVPHAPSIPTPPMPPIHAAAPIQAAEPGQDAAMAPVPPTAANDKAPPEGAAEAPKTRPAIVPPSSSGLLKGFSSLRGVTGS